MNFLKFGSYKHKDFLVPQFSKPEKNSLGGYCHKARRERRQREGEAREGGGKGRGVTETVPERLNSL